jgi:hypothetical protein
MARRISLVLMIVVAWAAGAETPAERCARTSVSRDPASAAYARRGAYCDGAFNENHSGPGFLPVIGVTATPVAGNVPVTISVLAVGAPANQPLQLQGVAKSPDVNYRFDAGLDGQPLVIGRESAMTRVRRQPLRAEEIAWAAWRDVPEGKLYVPVVAAGAKAGAVEIIVRPTFTASYVVYSLHTPGTPERELQKRTVLKGTTRPGEPVTLTIPPGQPDEIVVNVMAVAEDGDTQAATFRVLRPATVAK